MTTYNYIDETGKQHGTWKVLARDGASHGHPLFACECLVCGRQHSIRATDLRNNTPRCNTCFQNPKEGCRKCGCPDLAVREWTCDCECARPSRCPSRRPKTIRRECQPCHTATRKKARKKQRVQKVAMEPVDREKLPRLPAKPVVSWLSPYLGTHTIEYIAFRCGVNRDSLAKLMRGEQRETGLDTIDRLFCGMSSPGTLRELYPEIYEFTAEQMREAEEWANAA